jgi:glycosyltransferase involved in cell wall biosynthesis
MQGARIVPLVHDILPITRPEDYHAPWRDEFRAYVRQTLSFSDYVICVSAATRADIIAFMREESLDLPSCTVRHHGMDRLQNDKDALVDRTLRKVMEVAGCAVLTVGSIEPKKNHVLLLQACERLWSAGHRFNLIVVGAKGWLSDETTTMLRRHPQGGRRLFWFDHASELDLAHAYQTCRLVVLPSKAEGFGLPLLEALAYKRPVLASDIPPFKEVGGAFVDYFDPNSTDSLEKALGSLVADPGRLAELSDRAGRFTWPNWEAAVSESMQLLVSLSGKSTTTPVTEESRHSGPVALSR